VYVSYKQNKSEELQASDEGINTTDFELSSSIGSQLDLKNARSICGKIKTKSFAMKLSL